VCVQATPLKAPGVKAWSKPSRCTAGHQAGAAVRISPWQEGQPIILTEGVEDALAVLQACPSATVWAIFGAGNAARVQLPLGAPVTLCLDCDAAGRKAADAAATAFHQRGHVVRRVHLPDGFDPADLLQKAPRA
jgi:DNA primase